LSLWAAAAAQIHDPSVDPPRGDAFVLTTIARICSLWLSST